MIAECVMTGHVGIYFHHLQFATNYDIKLCIFMSLCSRKMVVTVDFSRGCQRTINHQEGSLMPQALGPSLSDSV